MEKSQMTGFQERLRPIMKVNHRPHILFVRGAGSRLFDADGNSYLDFVQGIAVNTLGHCSNLITSAMDEQARKLINSGPLLYNDRMIELASLLIDLSGLQDCFFVNSGAEANEGAIKLARRWGQKYRGGAFEIVTMHDGYHGRTLATMSASGKDMKSAGQSAWDGLFEPKVPGFIRVPFNDIAAVKAAISDATVALLIETVQGEAGVFVASSEFISALREITQRAGILLIVDEIQTGVGRTGKMFGFQQYGIAPDIITLAKGLGGGVPLGAMLANERASCFEIGDQGGTFNGSPLMTAVGCAVVRAVSDERFLNRVTETGMALQDKLKAYSREFGFGEVRGQGLLVGLGLGEPIGRDIVRRCLELGLIVNSPRADSLRFTPQLEVSLNEIDEMAEILTRATRDVLNSAS
jgi:acetylornithine/N-succinyldiaminopimelate aminotransferase